MQQRNLALVGATLGLSQATAETNLARLQLHFGAELFDCEGQICLPRAQAFALWPAIQDLLHTWGKMVHDKAPQRTQDAANAAQWQQKNQ